MVTNSPSAMCLFHGEVYKYGESIGRATQEIKVATMYTSTMWKVNADVVTGNNIKQGKMIMSNETFWVSAALTAVLASVIMY